MVNYKVKFKYYQYNSGCADNGTYIGERNFDDINKARKFKSIIDLAYSATKNDKYNTLSYNIGCKIVENIAYSGYITSNAIIYEITEKIIN